jgi:N-acetyl-gamma-glutamyl-phosphate reductase
MKHSAQKKNGGPGSKPGPVRVGIVGGAGFTGGELIRILIHHPGTRISFVHSKTHSGKLISEVHSDLAGDTVQSFSAELSDQTDVLFLCLGHGEAKKFMESEGAGIDKKIKIIDLSEDYRLHGPGRKPEINGKPFIYGLPELNREKIRPAHYVANPGCFATAIQLGLLPLAKAGLLQDVYTTGITGSTGAGQALSATSHFSWRANNIQAYKSLSHQHIHEVNESLQQLQNNFRGPVNFIPWRGDFTRGIFISSQMACDAGIEELTQLYEEFYRDHPFTSLSRNAIFLKQVVNTNKCLIQLEKTGERLVIHSALDNLLKGASGQAVQNMNLMFGMDEQMGLKLKAGYF